MLERKKTGRTKIPKNPLKHFFHEIIDTKKETSTKYFPLFSSLTRYCCVHKHCNGRYGEITKLIYCRCPSGISIGRDCRHSSADSIEKKDSKATRFVFDGIVIHGS